MYEMLVLELKQDLFMLIVESEDEDFESEEKAHEAMYNKRKIIDEKYNIKKKKRWVRRRMH